MDILSKYNESVNKSAPLQAQDAAEFYNPDTPKMIRWVMRYSGGLVKDEKQAGYVLAGFSVVAILIALFLIFGAGEGGGGTPLPYEQTYKPIQ